MKKMQIFEPAMCCPTGLCGVNPDPELLRISIVVVSLKRKNIIIERFNLNNAPQEFITNKEVNQLIMKDGVDSLPATLVDGKIVKTKVYPTNEEIINLLEIPKEFLDKKAIKKLTPDKKGGCC